MNSHGAIQRAELFKTVDKLDRRITQLEDSLNVTLRGCNALVDVDQVIATRLDIINKRLRKLEKKVKP